MAFKRKNKPAQKETKDQFDKPEIFKFQRSQMTSDDIVRQLCYNESRSTMGEVILHPASEDWRLHDTYGEKFYVMGRYDNKTGKVHFAEADILPQSKWPRW